MSAIYASPVDLRDILAANIYARDDEPPTTLDYRSELPRVRDQYDSAQCAAFAACAMKEWQERRDSEYTGFFDPEFIYDLRENKPAAGMNARNVMAILYKHGALTQVDKVIDNNTPEAASNYKIRGYAQVYDIKTLKKALYRNGPCLWAGPMYNKKSSKMWDIKTAHSEGNTEDHIHSAHAMAIVGYNDEGFILRNSFGADWSDDGHCVFPYTDWRMKYEIWTCIDDPNTEDTNGITNCFAACAAKCSQ